jgi:hypothetical protein
MSPSNSTREPSLTAGGGRYTVCFFANVKFETRDSGKIDQVLASALEQIFQEAPLGSLLQTRCFLGGSH